MPIAALNCDLVQDCNIHPPGFGLPRSSGTSLKVSYVCGATQTMSHVVES